MTTLQAPPVSLIDRYEGQTAVHLYKALVTITGGEAHHARASGRAVSDDGGLDVDLRMPAALGGPGGGANPQQLFAAGFGACFHGAMTLAAAKRRIALPKDLRIEVRVALGRDPADGMFLLDTELSVRLPGLDAKVAQELVDETEKYCFDQSGLFQLREDLGNEGCAHALQFGQVSAADEFVHWLGEPEDAVKGVFDAVSEMSHGRS